ncbi:CIS tube protein [Roseibium marinum]|uniref:Contractile injection system tube protein N-terminal domain-containing protein n=1 Tax=Roseibium marinum TaxID=281252 RepID=A0A2S3UMZ1_9HYPH|nr:hypothetical protein [Roseibium marinum]POF29088.1 hypothetical protein CLV41_11092 [Roseibium marinum]
MTNHPFKPSVTQGSLRARNAAPPIVAYFQFNPEKISDRRTVTYADIDAPGQILPFRQYVRGGERSLSFRAEIAGVLAANNGRIEIGEDGDISGEIAKYQALLYPLNPSWRSAGISQAATFASTREFRSPPVCVLSLGTRVLDCILSDLTVEETMFNAALLPVSASLRMTIKEIVPYGAPDLTVPLGGAA